VSRLGNQLHENQNSLCVWISSLPSTRRWGDYRYLSSALQVSQHLLVVACQEGCICNYEMFDVAYADLLAVEMFFQKASEQASIRFGLKENCLVQIRSIREEGAAGGVYAPHCLFHFGQTENVVCSEIQEVIACASLVAHFE